MSNVKCNGNRLVGQCNCKAKYEMDEKLRQSGFEVRRYVEVDGCGGMENV